jgi:hypothetical protein
MSADPPCRGGCGANLPFVTAGQWWLLLVGAVVLLVAIWTAWTLTRLRRLEARVARAWTALETQLQRRAGLAEELARACPAALGEESAARLTAAAVEANTRGVRDREHAENLLGHALRELARDLPGVPTALRSDLTGTATRLALARRFYNDAVRDTHALRRRRLSRLLRLHAHRPLPRFFDIDESIGGVTSGAGGAGQPSR